MPPKKTKRRKPLKNARTEAEVDAQLKRYKKLEDKWIRESAIVAKRLATNHAKVSHYQKRKNELIQVRLSALAALEAAANRPLRSINLGDD